MVGRPSALADRGIVTEAGERVLVRELTRELAGTVGGVGRALNRGLAGMVGSVGLTLDRGLIGSVGLALARGLDGRDAGRGAGRGGRAIGSER